MVNRSEKKSWIGIILVSTSFVASLFMLTNQNEVANNQIKKLQSHLSELESEKRALYSRVKRAETDSNGNFCPTNNHQLDMERRFTGEYYYQLIDNNAHTFDCFHISAPGFSNDIHIGFSNGCKSHDDEKWEIVLGGWSGTRHVIRDGNQSPKYGLVKRESCSDQFCSEEARKNR